MKEKHRLTDQELAESLFIINRHAKTAPNPKELYDLKKHTIQKLLKQNRAEKVGLHYSDHPKLSQQHSTLLIQVANYYFHIPARKQDFQKVQHLGELDRNYRNPKPRLSLSRAKKNLYRYLNWKSVASKADQRPRPNSYTTSSYLGSMNFKPWNQRGKRTR
ncbi:YkyB family protein [Thalassobacillus devorans]|uniref:YkyB family protein n=1 Tax=Thalassobacillus devorans TaxID=279813 RepID=UPI00048A7D27|nr:YkyB family protein [Thalassobacillus devorans]